MKGKVASIETMGLLDGPGIRTVIFLQGCPLKCLYCHNPEMQDCQTRVTEYTPKQLVDIIKRYKPYYKDDGGVTFSGGEPLMQGKFLLECLKRCKKEGINTCLDTSGVGKGYEEVLDYVDLVILDVKAIEENNYINLTGQKIRLFLDFLNTCQVKNKRMWLRQVIVPGINDTEENILKLKEFIAPLKNIERVELLPYHTMAKNKYKQLNREYPLKDTPEMDKEECLRLERILNK